MRMDKQYQVDPALQAAAQRLIDNGTVAGLEADAAELSVSASNERALAGAGRGVRAA